MPEAVLHRFCATKSPTAIATLVHVADIVGRHATMPATRATMRLLILLALSCALWSAEDRSEQLERLQAEWLRQFPGLSWEPQSDPEGFEPADLLPTEVIGSWGDEEVTQHSHGKHRIAEVRVRRVDGKLAAFYWESPGAADRILARNFVRYLPPSTVIWSRMSTSRGEWTPPLVRTIR